MSYWTIPYHSVPHHTTIWHAPTIRLLSDIRTSLLLSCKFSTKRNSRRNNQNATQTVEIWNPTLERRRRRRVKLVISFFSAGKCIQERVGRAWIEAVLKFYSRSLHCPACLLFMAAGGDGWGLKYEARWLIAKYTNNPPLNSAKISFKRMSII